MRVCRINEDVYAIITKQIIYHKRLYGKIKRIDIILYTTEYEDLLNPTHT